MPFIFAHKKLLMSISSPIDRFRIVAYLEGISYLLFAITMPLKYGMNIKEPNMYVGMAHGILFIAYSIMCIQCIVYYEWKFKNACIALIASLIPFGTFYADKKIFRNTKNT